MRNLIAVLFLMLTFTFGVNAAEAAAVPGADAFIDAVLTPIWNADRMRESVLFIQREGEAQASARLLFKPEKIISVSSATGEIAFESGTDFHFDEATATLRLVAGSRVPFKTTAELYPAANSKAPKIGHKVGDPKTHLLFGEGTFYHRLQVEVAYSFAAGQWKGYVPEFAASVLPRTLKKLQEGKPLTICLSGDSISQGYNATGFTKAPPFCPPYGELVARGLEKKYGSKINFKNFAIAGWSAGNGVKDVKKVMAENPDLVLIAYGMNDVGGRNTDGYKANIQTIINEVRKTSPDAEFILVASMLGNPEWSALAMDFFPKYRDALKQLCGPGVALADMTALCEELLKRKNFHDLTGNGVNHPNDFGHRLYAQTILALLIESKARAK